MKVDVQMEILQFFQRISSAVKRSFMVVRVVYSTPPKFNMEPENKSLEKESPFENHYFQVPCSFSGVYMMYMLLFLSADVFHPYFCNIQKTLPCWKIWLWLNMGNNGCDSNKTS